MKAPQRLPEPPRPLGDHGRALWERIQNEVYVTDAGGVEILTEACQLLDTAEALAAKIESDGLTVPASSGGLRSHPLLKDMIGARALVIRAIQRLGITEEPIKAMGRPTNKGWRGFDAD